MKTIQGSSRGRGGGSNYRGRGRGRGGGGRGRGRGGSSNGSDTRFASRFTDPRFRMAGDVNKKRQNPHDELSSAARRDPRFAKHFEEDEKQGDEEALSSSYGSGEEDEEVSSVASGEVGMDEEDGGSLPSEEEEALDDDVNAWAPEDVDFIEARRRVAIVNCDWDHIRAVDLFAVLFYALPLGGQLHNVRVYLSDFGKKMLEHERTHGPDLWAQPGEEEGTGTSADGEADASQRVEELPESDLSDAESQGDEDASDGWVDDNPAMLTEEGQDGEYFSSGKYRQYEMNRMKYYYAVATFDSPETAAAVYNELDGMDFEATGVVLDLRYIDDDETFENPVSSADRIPPNFKPLSSFKMAALTQSRFRISWDQEDVFRHQSVQDSFTGTTADDDLAAYMAPADSDDEEFGLNASGAKKGSKDEEKRRIRRKYAALLEEVGGLAEDAEEESNAEDLGGSEDEEDDEDDDDLNRFSDVEMDSDMELSGSGDAEDDRGSMGEMEATLDLDADDKASGLQRDMMRRQKMSKADLAKQAEIKYKLRRKEMKKSKKEMMKQEREEERAAVEANKKEAREKLKQLIGTDDDGAVHLSGKQRRKEHAKKVKARLAEERDARKKMRAAGQMGVTREVQQSQAEQQAETAVNKIDDRFRSKLLSDPRFHMEVAQKDKRIAEDVVELASTVAKARQHKRGRDENAAASNSSSRPSVDGDGVSNAVDFFLKKSKK